MEPGVKDGCGVRSKCCAARLANPGEKPKGPLPYADPQVACACACLLAPVSGCVCRLLGGGAHICTHALSLGKRRGTTPVSQAPASRFYTPHPSRTSSAAEEQSSLPRAESALARDILGRQSRGNQC